MKKICVFFILCLFPAYFSAQEGNNAILEKKLSEIYESDQSVRKNLSAISTEWKGEKPELKEKMDSAIAVMKRVDSLNQHYISNMLDSVGWPSDLSPQANMSIFMVIQHAPYDYMNKYSIMVEQQYKEGRVIPSLYAIFKDRLLMREGKKQIYGSQTMNGYVWPIEDIEDVDKRRNEMNLPPMQEYLQIFKNMNVDIIWDKEMTVEEMNDLIKKGSN